MQGRLTAKPTRATIDTSCGHCGREMKLTVDSEMHYEAESAGPSPLFFEPQIHWPSFQEPNIIHAY